MIAAAAKQSRVDLMDCFRQRADTRAYLWSIGEIDLHEAVDQLQADAVRDGLVEAYDQDHIQEVLARAFMGAPA
jgi:hypothetical protein